MQERPKKQELLKEYLQKYAENRQIRTIVLMIVRSSKHALTERDILQRLKELGYNKTHWAIRKILWKMVRDKELLKIKHKNQRYYLIFDENLFMNNHKQREIYG